MKDKRPILAVDFDGVLHSYTSGWKGPRSIPDAPIPGAIEWLEKMCDVPEALGGSFVPAKPFRVCIFSSRSRYWGGRRAIKRWLIAHGLSHHYFSDRIITMPLWKPPSKILLDDRAWRFDGTFPNINDLLSFEPFRVEPTDD